MTGLTEEEKQELMDKLIMRRTDFGDEVSAYITLVDQETEQIVIDLTTMMSEI